MEVVRPANDSAQALYWAMTRGLGTRRHGVDRNAGPAVGSRTGPVGAGARRPGIDGLTAAYELSRLGFDCTVLEAQNRAGGRNRAVRNGDEMVEIDASGSEVVTHSCSFSGDLYLNLGPGRIPYHHRRVLFYCRHFGAALEPYIMETTANLVSLAKTTRARWPNHRVANDVRGHLSALLHAYLTGDDVFTEDHRDLLRVSGDLSPGGEYLGSTRTGYVLGPGFDFPVPVPPLDLKALVASGYWRHRFYQPVDYLWRATMFQPTGGMDKIVTAFTDAITREFGEVIRLRAVVTAITLIPGEDPHVIVEYGQGGRRHRAKADYCVSNLPLPVLDGLAQREELLNFPGEFLAAIRAVGFAPTCKVGWQANRRFWENDQNAIYGGISWTDHPITQLWYPSNDLGSADGTLTGAYNFGEDAVRMGDLPPLRRLEEARSGAAELHREFLDPATVPLDRGISIAWHKIPHQLGGWADWTPATPSIWPPTARCCNPSAAASS